MACWVKTVPYMGAITHDETTAQLRQTGSARARSSTALNASMATAVVATSRPNPGMATAGAAKPPWAGIALCDFLNFRSSIGGRPAAQGTLGWP